MIRATKLRSFAFGFGHHCRGMMAANVEERAQHAVVSAHDHDRLSGNVARDVLAGFSYLVRRAASCHERERLF